MPKLHIYRDGQRITQIPVIKGDKGDKGDKGLPGDRLHRFGTTIVGDGTTKSWNIEHKLGTEEVFILIYDETTKEDILADTTRVDNNTVKIEFNVAPLEGEKYRVVVVAAEDVGEEVAGGALTKEDLVPLLTGENAMTVAKADYAETAQSALSATNATTANPITFTLPQAATRELNSLSFNGSEEVNIDLSNLGSSITVDDALDNQSTNPVQNQVVTTAVNQLNERITNLGTTGGAVEVDSVLKTDSVNPVQNKVITNKLNEIESLIPTFPTVDDSVTADSENPVSSKAVYEALPTIDSTLNDSSTNAIQNKAVKVAIDDLQEQITSFGTGGSGSVSNSIQIGDLNSTSSCSTLKLTGGDGVSVIKSINGTTATFEFDIRNPVVNLASQYEEGTSIYYGSVAKVTGILDPRNGGTGVQSYADLADELREYILTLPTGEAIISNNTDLFKYTSGNLIIGDGLLSNNSGNTNVNAGIKINLCTNSGGTRRDLVFDGGASDPAFYPTVTTNLGLSTKPWKQVYASTTEIATSDERLKNNITAIADYPTLLSSGNIFEMLFARLTPKTYYLNSEADKSELHIGFVAQDIAAIFEELGLAEEEISLLNHEYYIDEETGEEKDVYGLRYSEFIALNTYMIQQLSEKYKTLESRLAALESAIA